MPECPSCGRHLSRQHRNALGKLLYTDVFRCSKCGYSEKSLHLFHGPGVRFLLSRYTRCVQCGSLHVKRGRKKDHIDSVSRHLFSWIARLSGAPIVRCDSCRIQYYDWRRVDLNVVKSNEGEKF